ncbi:MULTISPECIES: tRNA (adenosine(37)-N6)-threonylcarbamoyltransferase complex dimerization subunit type 1 TsaB [unclassified Prochlorococcus]|uniref:tRNA (adenosine(37)-N6)-threonylcarbamoyltransferase complex dimerization subunit type 1 TsaB n=1 Tax=unclassified Prochlorococcus TaxID=2627481 RepID=UPI000533BB25|nr:MULTISPECIES: tRNA (adenosine(37)-N6)-threonylcarbamoyltransferase complex dimerization subunit type 1 TsaB [unclassified Prochlorococcus]KGG16798.1 inactive metal-dependent protease [Prochlorococcus sp. MIT 0602]KGG18228.1 inactive metal-dependent protease [Prochlorococcus sp. MIT 0603]
MNLRQNKHLISEDSQYLLALHSSTEDFGVGLIQLNAPEKIFKTSTFKMGKNLSNHMFYCIKELLPYTSWKQISRLAVATGPGGFTGTRLTIILARTISQQLNCPIDGISSFKIMAPRLANELSLTNKDESFWITHSLKRRGVVAGKYILIKNNNDPEDVNIEEVEKPHLIKDNTKISPSIEAKEDIGKDIKNLIKLSLKSHEENKESKWNNVLPIYPTSPVDNNK